MYGLTKVTESLEAHAQKSWSHDMSQAVSAPPTAPQAVYAEVKFSWQGSKDNHLSLVRGENVRVLQQSDKWWSGECQGKIGWFPKTFVKLLDAPSPVSASKEDTPTSQAAPTTSQAAVPQATSPVQPTPPAKQGVLYEAIYDYAGEAEGDLSFQAGDVIEVSGCGRGVVRRQDMGGWWKKLNECA